MRVWIACGGRRYTNVRVVRYVIRHHIADPGEPAIVFEGGAPGADTLVREACKSLGIDVVTVWPNWTRWPKQAGPIRNARMFALATAYAEAMKDGELYGCLAFPGGSGTADMAYRCEWAGMQIIRVDE